VKRILGVAAASLLLACLSAGKLPAQSQGPVYLQIALMKVAPGQTDTYVALEQELWKPVHQARVDAGKILGWYLYRVLSPRGTDVHHNYAVVNVFDGFEAMQNSYPEGVWEQVHPGVNTDDVWRKTVAARKGVRGETWRSVDATQPPLSTPSPYLMIDYMKVKSGDRAEYIGIEQDVWKPMHQAVVDNGDKASWELYALVFPWGSSLEYNYATVNAFNEYGDMDLSEFDFAAVFASTHPGEDPVETGRVTQEARDLVRGEIWHLIDHVQAPTE